MYHYIAIAKGFIYFYHLNHIPVNYHVHNHATNANINTAEDTSLSMLADYTFTFQQHLTMLQDCKNR